MRKFLILFSILFPTALHAENICLKNAMTQYDMNQCANTDLKSATEELQRVLSEIKMHYKKDKEFLKKLEESQKIWNLLADSNLEMLYPLENKQRNYGTVFPMCASFDRSTIVIERIAFLKKWLVGLGDGEVCGGSIYHSYCLTHDCSKL